MFGIEQHDCNVDVGTDGPPPLLGAHELTDLRISEVYRSLSVNGADADGRAWRVLSRLRVHHNYAENLGNSFFDTSGNIGTHSTGAYTIT